MQPSIGVNPQACDPMRVLVYLYFHAGGIGKYTQHWLQGMRADEAHTCGDLEIEVATPPDFTFGLPPWVAHWPHLQRISDRRPMLRRLRFLLGQWTSPRRALRRATEQHADVLHLCNINHLSFPLWRGALEDWGGILTCAAHDVRRRVAILSRAWEERQLRRVYRRCDAIFVHAEDQVRELVEFAGVDPARVVVVPHGPSAYDPPPVASRAELKRQLGMDPDRALGLFFGFIRPDKNLDGLLRAMARDGAREFDLLVAGNVASRGQAHLDACRAQVAALGLADRVRFDIRHIADREIGGLFAACDWVALPYHASFTSQSGVLNLAAHYRRPVLLTPTESFKEFHRVADIGVVAPGFDEAALAAGIARLHGRLRQGDAFAFDAYSGHYSWERNAAISLATWRALRDQRRDRLLAGGVAPEGGATRAGNAGEAPGSSQESTCASR